jgi:hypothetical protein
MDFIGTEGLPAHRSAAMRGLAYPFLQHPGLSVS